MTTATETRLTFPCFGGRAAVIVTGPEFLATRVRRRLEHWHRAFSRFDPMSELSLLNDSPAGHVRVSATMCTFVAAAVEAARRSGGLVDPTLAAEIESVGYRGDLGEPIALERSLALAPARRPAGPRADRRWRDIAVDPAARTVSRPRDVKLDSGGVAKGLFADLASDSLAGCSSYAIDCCGDLRLGGSDGLERAVRVDDPFGRGVLHEFAMVEGGVATSGIGKRSWLGPDGRPAHHLLDPSTGLPAYTGVAQATALAPSAAEAEVHAKAALLSGPERGRDWLTHGGVLVFDDGSHEVVAPRGVEAR